MLFNKGFQRKILINWSLIKTFSWLTWILKWISFSYTDPRYIGLWYHIRKLIVPADEVIRVHGNEEHPSVYVFIHARIRMSGQNFKCINIFSQFISNWVYRLVGWVIINDTFVGMLSQFCCSGGQTRKLENWWFQIIIWKTQLQLGSYTYPLSLEKLFNLWPYWFSFKTLVTKKCSR